MLPDNWRVGSKVDWWAVIEWRTKTALCCKLERHTLTKMGNDDSVNASDGWVNANGSSFKFELHEFVRVCVQRDLSFCAQ